MINKYFEFVQADLEPIKSFYIKDELNPKIWNKFEINKEIRIKLLKIGEDFYSELELNADVLDIVLVGSLCNYNWSEKYSDFDLHVIIKYSDIDDNLELVEKYCDYAKKIWNVQHEIQIEKYDVEIMLQDINSLKEGIETDKIGGAYSILKDKWVKMPKKVDFIPDEKGIQEKAKTIMSKIDDIEDSSEDSYDALKEKIKKVWTKVKDCRKSGLDSEGGEFSTGNLVFKLLRRNGYIGKVMKLKRDAYDKQFESLNEDEILKLLYFIEDIDKKYINTEGHSQFINCEYEKDKDFIDINYGWSTYEEGSKEDMRVFYKESPIRVEWLEDGSSVYGDYNNKHEYKFNSIDELISFIKNKYDYED